MSKGIVIVDVRNLVDAKDLDFLQEHYNVIRVREKVSGFDEVARVIKKPEVDGELK